MSYRPMDDYNQHRLNAIHMLISSLASTAAMTICLGSIGYLLFNSSRSSRELQKALIPAGLLAGISALYSAKVSDDTKYILQDYQDISDQQRTNRVYQEMAPVVKLEASKELRSFNWSTFKYKFDEYPHIGIIAPSGSGKSQLAEYICSLFDAVTIAVDPHYEVGHYGSAKVIVASRDSLDVSPLGLLKDAHSVPSFLDVVEGRYAPNIPEFVASVYSEMDWRLRTDVNGRFNAHNEPEVNIIWDEYNSYAAKSGKVFEKLLREARKAKLRNIFILQNSDVTSMGFEGTGGVRSNIVFIRLADQAVNYAETKVALNSNNDSEKDYWVQVLKAFKKDLIPCLVNDEYAIVPYIVK